MFHMLHFDNPSTRPPSVDIVARVGRGSVGGVGWGGGSVGGGAILYQICTTARFLTYLARMRPAIFHTGLFSSSAFLIGARLPLKLAVQSERGKGEHL